MSRRRYELDATATRSRNGRVLVGGTPPRMVRLTREGGDVLEAALRGASPEGAAARALIRRLLEAGLIHPTGTPPVVGRVTTIVPVHNGATWLTALVRALLPAGRVIVVDDRSSDSSASIAAAAGAEVVTSRYPRGPAGARNTGLELADTELVAFVDQDCTVRPTWVDPLVGLLADDPRLAIAAPRVRTVPRHSLIARYEQRCSPLDLGPHPAVVGPGRRLTFVPSAALVARREALLDVGGFDPRLRVGEDVDLVWRLIAAGWRVRYAPASEVLHEPRNTLGALGRQRFMYGTSAPALQIRHPGAATPLHVAPQTAGIWLAGVALGPVAAALALTASVLRAVAKMPDARIPVASQVGRGHLRATRHLARVAVREWLPLTALAATRSRRIRRLALAAFLTDAVAARAHPAMRLIDNGTYAAGLWWGAVRARSSAAIVLRRTRRARPDL